MDKNELKYILVVSFLLCLSFPPFPFGFFVPFALAIFIWFLKDKSPRSSFRLGYWFGLIWGAMTLFWIASSTVIGTVLTISINALHYALLWWIFSLFRKRNEVFALFFLPFLWCGMEYIRLFTDIRFNWLNLAYTQTYYTPFIQIIESTGYHILSFILLTLAISIYSLLKFQTRFRFIPLLLNMLLIIILTAYGYIRIGEIEKFQLPFIKVGLVQPNIDPYEKWDPVFQQEAFDMLIRSSNELVSNSLDIIVWPETAVPFYLRSKFDELKRITHFTDLNNMFLLTGTPDYAYESPSNKFRSYNAAFFFRPGSMNFEHYYKMALVPGSETIPFKKILSFLKNWDLGVGDFYPGNDFKVFNFKISKKIGRINKNIKIESGSTEPVQINLSSIICYDSVFPHIVREFVKRGANILTIITNDGWFGLTSGPYQHAQYAVLRAVENRVSIIRCANTGISCFIDPLGRIQDRINLNTRGNLSGAIPVMDGKTFYTENGDWFGKLVVCVALIFVVIQILGQYVLKIL